MAKDWRLLLSPPLPGPANMAVDEALLRSLASGAPPTIRFYTWDKPWTSVGRFQDASEEFDLALCATRGMGLVRRPTGGRAILHRPGDVTFSVAAPQEEPPIAGGIMDSYRSVNRALVEGLTILGIHAAMRERPPLWPETGVGVGCFEAAYRHEVYWAGRKLIASAQRRQGGGLLQQGTIPGTDAGADLASFVRTGPGHRVTLAHDLSERTGTLRRALDRDPSFEEVASALAEGFRRAWGIALILGDLTVAERTLASELERERYAQEAWNLARDPVRLP
ncbi:MAG: lipoate--protein ligase family protein [Chloroflexi bacterium]|nr:lipoate--protein ligase family protein [Chloroflexota bacterium]